MNYAEAYLSGLTPEMEAALEEMGYSHAVVAHEWGKDYAKKSAETSRLKSGIEFLNAALLKGGFQGQARRAQAEADLVYALSPEPGASRRISESWQVDAIISPEIIDDNDMMNQRNSGLDEATAKFMAERGMQYIVSFREILSRHGFRRAQLLDRIRQNLALAKKFGVTVSLASGAKDVYGLRSPRDLLSLSPLLDVDKSRKLVSEHPLMLFSRAGDRKNPDVIMKGLRVVDWGGQKPNNPKKKSGWY